MGFQLTNRSIFLGLINIDFYSVLLHDSYLTKYLLLYKNEEAISMKGGGRCYRKYSQHWGIHCFSVQIWPETLGDY